MIPAEAVEEAAKVLLGYTGACVCHEAYTGRNLIDPECRYHDVPPEVAKELLQAAAPHMLADVERELTDAKRMIALLVLEAGGKVALSRGVITEVSDATVIETMQDVVNGGWVIQARSPDA